MLENYTFNEPLTMSDIDASRVAPEFTIGTDKITNYRRFRSINYYR